VFEEKLLPLSPQVGGQHETGSLVLRLDGRPDDLAGDL
jgi:hypothetical protein